MPQFEVIRAAQIPISESNYVRETLRGLWEELPVLLLAALVVTFVSLPAVLWFRQGSLLLAGVAGAGLFAPVWSGFSYLQGRNAVGEKPVLRDLLPAVLHFYGRSLLSALPLAILTPVVFYFLPGLRLDLPLPVVIGIGLQVLACALFGLLLLFVLPLIALFNLPLHEAWKNSLYLFIRWPWIPVGLAAMGFLLIRAASWIGIGFWPVVPLLLGVFSTNAVLMLAKRVVETNSKVRCQ